MAVSDNKKQIAELKALRDKLNNAEHRKEYDIVVEACHQIIALDKRAKALKIIVPLYYKDLGEAYLRLLEYKKAVESFNIARDGLLEIRATQKLKFPEDWLAEIKAIDRLIEKTVKIRIKRKEI